MENCKFLSKTVKRWQVVYFGASVKAGTYGRCKILQKGSLLDYGTLKGLKKLTKINDGNRFYQCLVTNGKH